MSWAAQTARWLADRLRLALPLTAVLAVVAADPDGSAVETAGRLPAQGRFEIGSITKTMTGAVLASLVDDGIVALDDEVGRWLDAGPNAGITLRQLATHTAGLPRLSPGHIPGAPDPYAFLTAEVAERELRATPSRPRGVEHDYSNFGFQLLGLALERADGTPFERLIDSRVLQPLGMTGSGAPGHGEGAAIQGYASGSPVDRWTHHLYGAGGIEAGAEDLGRYLAACLNPPATPVGWAITTAQRPAFDIDPLRSVGLGWALGPPGYLGYSGGTSGFRSMLGINAPAGRAVAVFVNDHDARGLAQAVRDSLDT